MMAWCTAHPWMTFFLAWFAGDIVKTTIEASFATLAARRALKAKIAPKELA